MRAEESPRPELIDAIAEFMDTLQVKMGFFAPTDRAHDPFPESRIAHAHFYDVAGGRYPLVKKYARRLRERLQRFLATEMEDRARLARVAAEFSAMPVSRRAELERLMEEAADERTDPLRSGEWKARVKKIRAIRDPASFARMASDFIAGVTYERGRKMPLNKLETRLHNLCRDPCSLIWFRDGSFEVISADLLCSRFGPAGTGGDLPKDVTRRIQKLKILLETRYRKSLRVEDLR